jgi:hypothetical protein
MLELSKLEKLEIPRRFDVIKYTDKDKQDFIDEPTDLLDGSIELEITKEQAKLLLKGGCIAISNGQVATFIRVQEIPSWP